MKNLLFLLALLSLNISFSQTTCNVFPEKSIQSKKERWQLNKSKGFIHAALDFDGKIRSKNDYIASSSLGLSQSIGNHFLLGFSLGGGSLLFPKSEKEDRTNAYGAVHLQTEYYFSEISNGWGLGMSMSKYEDFFENSVYRLNILYAIGSKNKEFITLFYAGSSFLDLEKKGIIGGGIRIAYHGW
jgi:hypothetical protein